MLYQLSYASAPERGSDTHSRQTASIIVAQNCRQRLLLAGVAAGAQLIQRIGRMACPNAGKKAENILELQNAY
jgi:hypothetical protein